MELEILNERFAVCRVSDFTHVNISEEFVFTAKTDEEYSLVCPEKIVPENTLTAEAGWRALRIKGTLDFSLTGILAGITAVLAQKKSVCSPYRRTTPIIFLLRSRLCLRPFPRSKTADTKSYNFNLPA